ncbi:MAG: hypothetical protein CMJ25_02005 [Phycisphaerae bacterium]|nr:hypothetical protein [Phycisphaerae bacterium]|tara:strand:- start:352 stop:1968 length:1617 start_codon:yes stop_codon:yes gene_type:complete
MSQLNSLLESSAGSWKNLQSDAAKLAGKWNRTGLLEGLGNEIEKNNMSMILENQAKQLVTEASLSGGGVAGGTFTAGTGEQWAGVALPMVRKVFGQIAAQEFVSVQPMNLPSGLVFFLDFQYGTAKTPFTAGGDVYGSGSMYGLTEGDAPSEGLYGAGRFGYSINNTASVGVTVSTTSSTTWADFNYDSAFSASAIDGTYKKLAIAKTEMPNGDFLGARAFIISGSGINNEGVLQTFTTTNATEVIVFSANGNLEAGDTITYQLQPLDNERGDFEDQNDVLNGNNSPISIPEINVKLKSEAIVAKTRKLKAVWTPEFAQDLNAYQSLDAEAELTSIMSEYIAMEIDLEILDMLIQSVPATNTEVWSAKNNESLSGATTSDLGFYNSQGQWFQTLGTKLQKVSNKIHQLTLRGGANFLVCSPTVATVLESIPGFAANSDGDAAKMKYAFGVQKVGAINSRYDVYKNPYMTENTILMGYRGSQFLETGAVFAPYIPLIMTPLVYDPDTFTPRKGLLTRYAKKMIRPEFYGKIDVAGLNSL